MKNNINKGLIIGGIFSAQVPDKSGEIIDIEHMDITSLNDGTAILNAEHETGKFSSYLGRILEAKKIFKEEDCKTEHERKCFESAGRNQIIYGICSLFDDEDGHAEAKHAAAVIKSFKKNGLPIAARFSIEGSSLEKDGSLIKRSVARRVALTIAPCNAACESEVISEFSKSEVTAYSNITKGFNINKGLVTPDILLVDQSAVMKSLTHLQGVFDKLKKALEAGIGSGAPGTLTQGAALQSTSGSRPMKSEESESSSSESTAEDSQKLKPVDHDKLDEIDDSAKNLEIKKVKLKKAEIFILKALTGLKK